MDRRVAPAIGVAVLCAACSDGAATHDVAPTHTDGGDPNATFGSAKPIQLGSRGILETVDGKEDKDFFSFDGRRGQWIEIRSSSLGVLDVFDTRLTLYDAKQEQVAYNQSAKSLKGENILARIVTELPADGKYFVEVGDPGAAPVSAGFSQAYRLEVTDLAEQADGYTIESDAGSDPTPVTFHRWDIDTLAIDDSFVMGSFSDAGDVDAFSFTVSPGSARTLSGEIQESGKYANGATNTLGKVWITSEADTTVIARIDNSVGQKFLSPPLDPGGYRLWVAHPETPQGTNDFYVVRAMLGPENPIESAESTNDSVSAAEPLATITSAGGDSAFILAYVLDADVDYFRFDAHAGESAAAYCESAGGGSGIVGLHISVRDDTDTSLAEAMENPSPEVQDRTVALEGLTVPASGSLYVRAWKDSQLSDVTGNWARCAIYAQ